MREGTLGMNKWESKTTQRFNVVHELATCMSKERSTNNVYLF